MSQQLDNEWAQICELARKAAQNTEEEGEANRKGCGEVLAHVLLFSFHALSAGRRVGTRAQVKMDWGQRLSHLSQELSLASLAAEGAQAGVLHQTRVQVTAMHRVFDGFRWSIRYRHKIDRFLVEMAAHLLQLATDVLDKLYANDLKGFELVYQAAIDSYLLSLCTLGRSDFELDRAFLLIEQVALDEVKKRATEEGCRASFRLYRTVGMLTFDAAFVRALGEHRDPSRNRLGLRPRPRKDSSRYFPVARDGSRRVLAAL